MVITSAQIDAGVIALTEGVVTILLPNENSSLIQLELTQTAGLRLARRLVDVIEENGTHSRKVQHGEAQS